MRERCLADVRDFHLTYYGRDITPPTAHKGVPAPAAAPFFAAVGAVIETIVNIITPVVVEGAKIVDEEARRRTVIAFLKNETNIKTIRESGLALATEVSAFTWNKRLRLAGSFSERAAVLRASPVDLSKGDSCKKYLAAGQPTNDAKTSLTDDFILCWRAAWEQVESNVAALLKVAEEYDRLADAGDTDNAHQAFRPLADSLQAITTTDETDLKRFWGWATRLLAFAQKVETALSKESREKIEKAIDDLVKAI